MRHCVIEKVDVLDVVEEGGLIDLLRKRLRLLRGQGGGVDLVPQA